MKDLIAFHQSTRLAHTRAFYDTPDPATPRNLTTELTQTLAGHQATAPGYLALHQRFDPQYDRLNLDRQSGNMFGFYDADGNYHPGTLSLGQASNRFQRSSDIADLADLGPDAQAAYLAANPDLAYGIGQLRGRMADSPILSLLNDQALTDLHGNGQLSPQDERALEQQSRGVFSDRGNVGGNQAMAAELLNRDAAVRSRRAAAQQFATGVQGLNQTQNDFVGRGTQIFGTVLADPVMTVLGRGSGSGASGGSGGGYPQPIGSGADRFDPMNAYANDIYNSNFNAENANNIATANANNASTSSYLSLAGSLLGGLLVSDERLKKNVKRTGKKTADGIPKSRWKYKTDPKGRTYEGVTAQDAAKHRPDAVHTDRVSGLKTVNYSILSEPMKLLAA